MIENSTDGLTLLDAGHQVTLTREEDHQDVLRRYQPRPGGYGRRVAVELIPFRIPRGTHAGRRGIEVRLDGRRIGELTPRMSQRYFPLVDDAARRGERPGCVAVIGPGKRAGVEIEVELFLPEVTAGPVPPPTPRRRRKRPVLIGAGVATAVLVGIGSAVGGGNGGTAVPELETRSSAAVPTTTMPTSAMPTTAPTSTPAPTTSAAPIPSTAGSPVPAADVDKPPATRATPQTSTDLKKKSEKTRDPAPLAGLPEKTREPATASYKNCDEVRAAGKAPLLRGQPGYRKGLDREGDGIACE